MEWAVIARMAPKPVQQSGEGHRKGLCKGIEATKRGTPVFVEDAQLVQQSPVMGGGWSGVGGLLTVVASSLRPSPKPSLGDRRESENRNIRTKGPSLL